MNLTEFILLAFIFFIAGYGINIWIKDRQRKKEIRNAKLRIASQMCFGEIEKKFKESDKFDSKISFKNRNRR